MNERVCGIIGLYAGGIGAAVVSAVYAAHHGFSLTGDIHPFGLGIMAVIAALGAASFLAAVIATGYSLWVAYGQSVFSLVSKVLLGAWGVSVTVAVALLLAKQFGLHIGR